MSKYIGPVREMETINMEILKLKFLKYKVQQIDLTVNLRV